MSERPPLVELAEKDQSDSDENSEDTDDEKEDDDDKDTATCVPLIISAHFLQRFFFTIEP
jgi:hypothetical protein